MILYSVTSGNIYNYLQKEIARKIIKKTFHKILLFSPTICILFILINTWIPTKEGRDIKDDFNAYSRSYFAN